MGRLVAERLAGAGHEVTAYDVHRDTLHALPAEVARADGLDDLVGCEVVVLSLPTPAVVLDVVQALAPGAPSVLDTSTVDPGTTRAAAEVLTATGGRYADCPVLGRPSAVGSWTIPVGGDDDLVALAGEVLAPLAKRVVGVGPTGAAATLKVLNNLMLGVINSATAEVLTLAEASGLDPAVFVDTLLDSGAASVSGLFREVAPRAVTGDFAPTFSVALMHKDNALALALADSVGVRADVGRAAQALNQRALDAGLGAEDSIAVLKVVHRQ